MDESHPKQWEKFFETFSRGTSTGFENLRQEFRDMTLVLENTIKAKTDKERELNILTLELGTVRDQIKASKQTSMDSSAQQFVLRRHMEALTMKGQANTLRELSNRQEIVKISSEFDDLKNAIAIGSGWTSEQDEQRLGLLRERDFMSKKLESMNTQSSVLRNELQRIVSLLHDTEDKIHAYEEEKQVIQTKVSTCSRNASTIVHEQRAIAKSIADVQLHIQQAQVDLSERNSLKRAAEKTLANLDSDLLASKAKMSEYLREYDTLLQTLQDMTVSLSRQKLLNKKSEEDMLEKQRVLQSRLNDVETMEKENMKLLALSEIAKQKVSESEYEKKNLEEKKEQVIAMTTNTRDVLVRAVQRETESCHLQRSALLTELSIVKKKYTSSDQVAAALADIIRVNTNATRNLSVEKATLEKSIASAQQRLDAIFDEKAKLDLHSESMNQQYYTELEECKLQELQVKELQKKISEDTSKLKQKQNLYEVVRSDRNLYSKQLVDLQNDINTLKTTFRQMNHTIEQQEDDISARDSQIVKEHFLHHSVEKERELLKNQLIKSRKQVLSSKDIVDNQQVEIVKLSRIIAESDQERNRQRNELSSVLAERNLLTSQVVKRNSELELVYSKIKVQRNNLRMGEIQYDKLMKSIYAWYTQIVTLVKSKNDVVDNMRDFDEVKRKNFKLQKELRVLKVKCRALHDELDLPINIHRWRILESSDPNRYELICRIQDLQKQLIAKSDAVVEREASIVQVEKTYAELKSVISRQPGPEVEEQILVYQQTLKDKFKQLKAMDEELGMYRQQVSIYKADLKGLDNEMEGLRKQWFRMVRRKE